MGIYKGSSCGLEGMPWGVGCGDRIFRAGEVGPGQATAHKGTICIKNPVRDHPHAKEIFNPFRSLSVRRRDFPGSRKTFDNVRAGAGPVRGTPRLGDVRFRPSPHYLIGGSGNQCYKSLTTSAT